MTISVILLCAGDDKAQTLRARVSVLSLSPVRLKIEGEIPDGAEQWSFLNAYGGIVGLADRIHNLTLADSAGNDVSVRSLAPGEFRSEKKATHFTYEVNASAPQNFADASHISWLNSDYGYLMPVDLLPNLSNATAIRDVVLDFVLPQNWSIASSIQPDANQQFRLPEPATSVFFLSRALREKRKRIGQMEFAFATSGDWAFSDEDATRIAAKVLKDYAKQVGHDLDRRSVLMLAALPGSFGAEHWSAETRGSNIVLLLGRNSPRDVLVGKLSVVLTHELFHLWVPNGLSLDGSYDWFFEGFTLYQALRTAVRLGFVTFQEYLNTLARVYDSYLATPDRDRLSLIEASQQRWTSATSIVYDKGMLVAFAYDLMLHEVSEDRRSLDDVYRELFRRFPQSAKRVDGNEAIVSLLNEELGSREFAERYITGRSDIALETLLSRYGLIVETVGDRKRLTVKPDLPRRQRQLLRSLGYNHKS